MKKIKSSDDSFVQEQLELFVKEWKHETKKEKEELEALKSRVGKRKVQRAEQEAQLAEMRAREQQLQIQQMEEEKQRKHEEKLRRLEEAEKKRQQLMMESQQGDKGGNKGGRNFVIDRRVGFLGCFFMELLNCFIMIAVDKHPVGRAGIEKGAFFGRIGNLEAGGFECTDKAVRD